MSTTTDRGPAAGRIDLNADLGEGVTDDAGLLAVVTSANVACGFHAGDLDVMRAVCEAAAAGGVVVGAQVSYLDREGFGRRPMDVAEGVLRAGSRSRSAPCARSPAPPASTSRT